MRTFDTPNNILARNLLVSTFLLGTSLLQLNKSPLLILSWMTEKELQEAIDNLKLERVNSYGASGKIISQWKLKTLINGIEIDLEDELHI